MVLEEQDIADAIDKAIRKAHKNESAIDLLESVKDELLAKKRLKERKK